MHFSPDHFQDRRPALATSEDHDDWLSASSSLDRPPIGRMGGPYSARLLSSPTRGDIPTGARLSGDGRETNSGI